MDELINLWIYRILCLADCQDSCCLLLVPGYLSIVAESPNRGRLTTTFFN